MKEMVIGFMELMERSLNSKKVKYVVLKELMRELPSNTNEINIFLSVESIIKRFYDPKIAESISALDSEDKYLLSSELLNIVAHYRHFFWSRYSIPTNFFVYYSTKPAKYNRDINEGYKESYYNHTISSKYEFVNTTKHVRNNLELSSVLSEYLPNIYMIDTKTLEPSVLPYYIIKENGPLEGLTNIVMTNNKMEYQLVNLPNTFIMDLNMDKTKIISRNNVLDTFISKSKTKDSIELSSAYYNHICSISGYKSANLTGVKGYGNIKTITALERLAKNGAISNERASRIDVVLEEMFTDKEQDKRDVAANNYKAFSLANMCKHMSPKEKNAIDRCLRNKTDNLSLMQINDKYYSRYPLMLIELMEGE